MNIAILGAGAGGASAAVELSQNGHAVRLWTRSPDTLAPFTKAGGIAHTGVFGDGRVAPDLLSTDLGEVLDDVDVALVCLPTSAHGAVAQALLQAGAPAVPVVLNPGHTGGVLEFRQVFAAAGREPPPVAELSTLTYVARLTGRDTVATSAAAARVRVAALPRDEAAVGLAQRLFPAAVRAPNLIATGLANVNMVLHPPGAILGAAWVEASGGRFTFYVEGLTGAVGRVLEALDSERLQVAAAYGLELPDLFGEMQAIGTIEADAERHDGVVAAIRAGTANGAIMAPDSLGHRYYLEDFFYGLRPFLALADIAGVATPVAAALMTLAETAVDPAGAIEGRSASAMGIDGLNRTELLQLVGR
ncbi:MAG: NAD/NADP octopine/nopaline dehydrogenase family protein [Pseudomonadota bacterium]